MVAAFPVFCARAVGTFITRMRSLPLNVPLLGRFWWGLGVTAATDSVVLCVKRKLYRECPQPRPVRRIFSGIVRRKCFTISLAEAARRPCCQCFSRCPRLAASLSPPDRQRGDFPPRHRSPCLRVLGTRL